MLLAVGLALLCVGAAANGEQIDGPAQPADWPAWLQQQLQYRKDTLAAQQYNGSIYSVPALRWTQDCWIQPQMHPYDRYFYDPATKTYTVDRYLDDLRTRYGGIDCLLLWPTYTNIGIDNRNQYDLIRALPGHVTGLQALVDQLQARGVRVLYPYNPWDQGTRPEGMSDPDALAQLMAQTHVDGFNGDTMSSVPEEFYLASVRAGRPAALEPEGGGSVQSINWDTMGWGYWDYPHIPAVDRWKWLDPRRMTNVCDRWAHDKTNDLQFAFFNGDGYESWENVWGIWNGITDRDAEALRRVGTLLRFFGPFLHSMEWEPHTPVVNAADVFASKWPLGAETFWTFVNRNGAKNYTGRQITFTAPAGLHYYDCYHGVELTPQVGAGAEQSQVTLAFDIEASGYGAVLASPNATRPGDGSPLGQLLAAMAAMTGRALASYSAQWTDLKQTMVAIPPTRVYPAAPAGMVAIPGGVYNFATSRVEIEGGDGPGQDVQFPWEDAAYRNHRQTLLMVDFYIDKCVSIGLATVHYVTYGTLRHIDV